jgi:PilZ domain
LFAGPPGEPVYGLLRRALIVRAATDMNNVGRKNMETKEPSPERRKELRYPVEAKVLVQKANGETLHARAVDISSSGMRLLWPNGSCLLTHGEEVTVDVEFPEGSDKPFSAWGLGRVAHIDSLGAGIQLFGGQFDPLSQEDGQ